MQNQNGASLIEVLMVLAVAAILVGVGVSNMEYLVNSQRANGAAERLYSALQVARSESVKRSEVVTICGSEDGQACDANWAGGWLLYVDDNRDGQRDAGEISLQHGQVDQRFRLEFSAFGSTRYLRFSPIGITYEQNGTFTLCPDDGDERYARALIVSKLARVRFGPDGNGDGIREDASGNPLSCS
ncbi:MAG: GspH/FimT family pseudopilin [bacterium]